MQIPRELSGRVFDADLAFNHWFCGYLSQLDQDFPEWLSDAIEWDNASVRDALRAVGYDPPDGPLDLAEIKDVWESGDLCGWIAEAAVPYKRLDTAGNGTISWGTRLVCYVGGADIQTLIEAAITWAEESDRRARTEGSNIPKLAAAEDDDDDGDDDHGGGDDGDLYDPDDVDDNLHDDDDDDDA